MNQIDSEKFRGVFDDTDDESLHGSQHGKDSHAVGGSIGFREDYERRHVIHMHREWSIWDRPTDVQYLCARFYFLMRCSENLNVISGLEVARNCEPLVEDQDDAVFIDVVELAEDVERVSGRIDGVSLVWLRLLDELKLLRPDKKFQRSLADQGIGAKVQKILVDRTLQSKLLANRMGLASGREGAYQMIEHGAELVQGVTENDSAIQTWYRRIGAVM